MNKDIKKEKGVGKKNHKRLTKEEIVALCEKIKLKDPAAVEQLVIPNIPLAGFIAKRFLDPEKPDRTLDDLASIGRIGLIKAAKTFDIDREVKFSTYAVKCIKNEILMYLRKANNKSVKVISFETPCSVDYDGHELTLFETFVAPNSDFDEQICDSAELQDKKQMLMIYLEKLPYIWRQVIILRYGLYDGECKKQTEISEILGLSQSYISRVEKRAIDKLRLNILAEEKKSKNRTLTKQLRPS
jgi:RNA polymerase sporulation-specific sigma factor